VIQIFRDHGTEDVYDGFDSRRARKACPSSLWIVARRRLDQINRARDL
jgi:proteic killer suppression protein